MLFPTNLKVLERQSTSLTLRNGWRCEPVPVLGLLDPTGSAQGTRRKIPINGYIIRSIADFYPKTRRQICDLLLDASR